MPHTGILYPQSVKYVNYDVFSTEYLFIIKKASVYELVSLNDKKLQNIYSGTRNSLHENMILT